jgi:hypothetical protein
MKKLKEFRNPFYNHPLMTKSHSHDKSKKSLRNKDKVNLKKDLYKGY